MRHFIAMFLMFMLILANAMANEWPIYFPAVVSDPVTPTPDTLTPTPPGTHGNGVLNRDRIALVPKSPQTPGAPVHSGVDPAEHKVFLRKILSRKLDLSPLEEVT